MIKKSPKSLWKKLRPTLILELMRLNIRNLIIETRKSRIEKNHKQRNLRDRKAKPNKDLKRFKKIKNLTTQEGTIKRECQRQNRLNNVIALKYLCFI